jgi:DNA mismatch endonuclease (patch repair protein)
MADVLTAEQRHLNMSRIRGRDTKPEMLIRRGLHARGLRYRLHDRKLPGGPDLVFARYRTVVFVHGCFWHKHDCPLAKLPATRQDFWLSKLEGNAARDTKSIAALQTDGWNVLVVWECALRGPGRLNTAAALDAAASYIRHNPGSLLMEIAGESGRRKGTTKMSD